MHGPDYSAAIGSVTAGHARLLRLPWQRSRSESVSLRIDHLGNDVWYARSAAPSHVAASKGPGLDIELLVSAGGRIPAGERRRLLDEGRSRQASVTQVPSKWRMVLPSGAGIELIGICENPSAGRTWWGPDGSLLDYRPYFNDEPCPRQYVTTGQDIYEIAWVTHGPGVSASVYRELRELMQQMRDRYGETLFTPCAAYFAVDKSTQVTNLTFQVQTQGKGSEWVVFRDVSLVRGEDHGCEIIRENSPTEE
jgi:hypothetical protein